MQRKDVKSRKSAQSMALPGCFSDAFVPNAALTNCPTDGLKGVGLWQADVEGSTVPSPGLREEARVTGVVSGQVNQLCDPRPEIANANSVPGAKRILLLLDCSTPEFCAAILL